MISAVFTVKEGMETKNQIKKKIEVGYVVKAKVRELEKITRDLRSMRMSQEVVGCVQIVVEENNFLVQFKYGQKKEISSY